MVERQLSEEREQLKDAIDWIDKERQRLKRGAFNATRQAGSGRGFHITVMKKKGEWLYAQRCLLRNRLSDVGTALKDMRRAANGKPNESFNTVFFRIARDNLDRKVFDELLQFAQAEHAEEMVSDDTWRTDGKTALDILKERMEQYVGTDSPKPKNESVSQKPHRPRCGSQKESQEDFGIHALPEGGVSKTDFAPQEGRGRTEPFRKRRAVS